MDDIIEYKGYFIDNKVTYENLITVQLFNGDDVIFKTVEEAKRFIDEIREKGEI